MFNTVSEIVGLWGATGIMTGGVVVLFRRPKEPDAPPPACPVPAPSSAVTTERFVKVEAELNIFKDTVCGFGAEFREYRAAQDRTAENIYKAIKDVNDLVIELLRETKQSRAR